MSLEDDSVEGNWKGTVDYSGKKLKFELELVSSSDGFTGIWSAVENGIRNFPLRNIIFQSGDRRFSSEINSFTLGNIEFIGQLDKDTLSGSWKNETRVGSFHFSRITPVKAHFTREDVSFNNGDIRLAGSLFLPVRKGPHPTVVALHSAGPQTRRSFQFLAEFMTRHGFAFFAWDKRGAGESGGDWQDVGFEALGEDGLAAIQTISKRSDIDSRRIGLYGFSQAGWVLPYIISKSDTVSFAVFVSPWTSTSAQQNYFWQQDNLKRNGFNEDNISTAHEILQLQQHYQRTGEKHDELDAELAKYKDKEWFSQTMLNYPIPDRNDKFNGWLRLILDFDPRPYLKQMIIPSLWIFGENDTLVYVPESSRIAREMLEGSPAPPYQMKTFPRANHAIRIMTDENGNWIWSHLAPGYLETIEQWLQENVLEKITTK